MKRNALLKIFVFTLIPIIVIVCMLATLIYQLRDKNEDSFGIKFLPQNTIEIPESQKKIILISIDTLRPDYLGFNGYDRDTSPNIDKIANESIVFDNAYTPIPHTTPAHISMLSGQHPNSFQIFSNLYEERVLFSLAKLFEYHDFETAAFISSDLVNREYFYQGFKRFDFVPDYEEEKRPSLKEAILGLTGQSVRRSGSKTNQGVINWLQKNYDQSFFLWIHYYDAGAPFINNCKKQSFAESLEIPENEYLQRGTVNPYIEATPSEAEYVKALYNDGIYCADKYFGDLINSLKGLDIYNDTTIILTSDHGEGFEDFLFHGQNLYDTNIRVPLIIKSPLFKTAPTRIETPVSIIDIAPTLTNLFGFYHQGMIFDGEDLKSIIQGESIREELFFITQDWPQEEWNNTPKPKPSTCLNIAVLNNNRKLISNKIGVEMYDMINDPNELENIVNLPEEEKIKLILTEKMNFFFREIDLESDEYCL